MDKNIYNTRKNTTIEEFVLSNKYAETNSDLTETFKEQICSKYILDDYSPFALNDILAIENTKTTMLILLKNGIVISYGEQSSTLGRKFNILDRMKPDIIPFKRSVVDITCGRDHCLAKTDEFKIYSWGNNYYGQLGLHNFTMNLESNKDEPTEIIYFSKNKVSSIKCGAYNSYAIDEDNSLYGWGSNEFGQLFLELDVKKISTPTLMNTKETLNNYVVDTNKKSKAVFLLECNSFYLIN